jgi:two-component system phosphate regulon sensor histidine kinase PhoR
MNRRIILLTIVTMTLALTGLMTIQIFWLRSASAIREANFRRSVNEAMVRVVGKIERIEKNRSLITEQTDGLLQLGHLPFNEFITPARLDSLIRLELSFRGIDTRYEYCIYKPELQEFIIESNPNFRNELIEKGSAYVLFQADINISPEYLLIWFPREKQFLLTELWGMLLISTILIVVIVYAFTYTIAIIFRQKRLSEMKNDFINNMTHEFKTPIATISLACEALSDNDLRNSGDILDSYLGMIREENQRLAVMSEKILQTAVIDKGQLKMKTEKIDLHTIILEVIRNLKIQVEIKDGVIIHELGADPPVIEGDRVHITNLVYNLLDNANKYSPKKPVIRITTAGAPSGIVMTIEDNGIGISKQEQKRIFEKLYRVPTGNIHDVRGFGLGLNYVKAIVNEHHGRISLESEINRGSKFRIFLPYRIKE